MIIKQSWVKSVFDYDEHTGMLIRNSTNRATGWVSKSNCKEYYRVDVGNKKYRAHRLIYVWHHGDTDFTGLQIDHIDGNGLNNRIENLRLVTPSQNNRNQHKLNARNTSGITGVYRNQSGWTAEIYNNERKRQQIYRKDFFEACCVRKSLELKYNYDLS